MPSAEELVQRSSVGADVPVGNFARDTEVWADAARPGRFHAHLSEAWKVFYAFGGCSMAIALRAAGRAIDRPDLQPRSANATFVSPVMCGPLVVDTEVLRSGRSAAQALAKLRTGAGDDGTTDVFLTTIFGNDHPSHIDFLDTAYPEDARSVEDSLDRRTVDDDSPFRNINYHRQTEFRMASVGFDFRDPASWQPGPARTLTWHRLIDEPRLADGTIDPVSYCAPADILGPAVFAKLGPMGPDNPPFLVLSLEIDVQFVGTTRSPWILQHTRVPHASSGYAYAVVELWSEERELIALATQRGHVRPVTIDRFAQPDGTA